MFNRRLAFAATAIGVVLSSPALAQTAPGTGYADEIVVTARRVEEKLQDVPISITVYNQEQIDDRNISVATDLATYTPSLSVNQRYGPEKASFAIRGFNQDMSTAPTVGVYFADVVGVRAQGGTTSGNTVGAGAFMDLQNVQVLKGPQGTLFGRNTTGGAILLVPNKPTDRFEGYAEGTLGNYDLRRLQGALNVPLSDAVRARLAVDRQERDGYMRNRSGIGPEAYNDLNYLAARFSLVADLTPDLENYLIAHISDSDTNGYASRLVMCDPAAVSVTALTSLAACDQIARQNARGDGRLDVEVSNPDPFVKLKQWQAINTTTWRASDNLTVKNIVSYGEFREKVSFNLYSDNFFVPNPAPSLAALGLPPLVPGTPFQYIRLDKSPGLNMAAESTFTEELQLQGRTPDGRFDWVAGGYLEFSRPIGWSGSHSAVFLNCASPEDLQCANPLYLGFINASRTRMSFDNHGIFAQGTYRFTDKWALTLGGRYTFDKIKALGETTQVRFLPGAGGVRYRNCYDTLRFTNPNGSRPKIVTSPAECRNEIKNSSKRPTWLANLDYKPVEDVLLYAKYARGYRQGGVNMTNVGSETWDPETVDAYELGAKTAFRGRVSGYFNVAAFYNDFRDQQLIASLIGKPGVAGGTAIMNAGKSKIAGVEIDASVRVFERLRFDLGYTYLDTKVKELTAPVLPPESPFARALPNSNLGDPLTLSPKNRVTVSAIYTAPLDERLGELSLGATFVHTDKQIANGAMPAAIGVLPDTDLLNLNVNWDRAFGTPVDVAFFATNVTKEIYPVSTGGGFSSGVGDLLMGQPRMYGVRVKYHFGQ